MSLTVDTSLGQVQPLGASVINSSINFAVYAPDAQQVFLCLFDKSGHSELLTLAMHNNEGGVWSLLVSQLEAGCLYGYRAEGNYKPAQGAYFNGHKLLLDPYAKDFFGDFTWSERHYGQMPVGTLSKVDNAIDMPKSRVTQLAPYQGKRPNHSYGKTVIYECHVKGATCLHPDIPTSLQGKFLGLSDAAFISHLHLLGVTAIELLPCHAFISEQFLTTKGLQNYWGYNTFSFFTPHKDYLVNDDISEFQQMVSALHQAGIEVIIDVVYNHSAEAGADGPILSLRGLNNKGYYRALDDDPNVYINDTGCGNTLNIDDPYSLKLVLDSLRYWVEIMGVDGFRFDLATILGRTTHGFSHAHSFFQAVNQDPILCKVKLIAEPWDIGPGGYQLGAFSAPWREWNDQYRDVVRKYWRGDQGMLPDLAKRLHGSFDLFEHNLRGPLNSINFITSHDGFTLADLVSYEEKHNEANAEQNRDGHSANYSFNCGVEGFTSDEPIKALRLTQQKNLLLTLLLSKGVPMIAAGTEMAHSQGGNNNAYCQNNKINWLGWKKVQQNHPLTTFISELLKIRKAHCVFKHSVFLHDSDKRFSVNWYSEKGQQMRPEDWHESQRQLLMYSLSDEKLGMHLLIILNASEKTVNCQLPMRDDIHWQLALTSVNPDAIKNSEQIQVTAQSSWVFTANLEDQRHG